MDDLLRLLTLQDANTRVVLAGAALLGLASGVVGTFAVLRRRSLAGDAIAHAALPGVCLAFLIVGERNFAALLLGALLFGVLGVACIAWLRAYTKIREDAALGIVLSSFFGLGLVISGMIQRHGTGNRAGLDTFILGKAAGMVRQDVYLIAAAACVVIAATVLLHKEFKALCFDRAFAASLGRPVTALDLLLMTLVAITTVIGLPAVGVVLMAALLIIPAAAARFWTERLGVMVALSGGFGLVSGIVGVAISATVTKLSAGPLVALAAASIFILSLLFAPRRGVVAGFLRSTALRRKVALQNLLRALYEAGEADPNALLNPSTVSPTTISPTNSAHARADIALRRAWSPRELDSLIARAQREKLITLAPSGCLVLTDQGRREAALVVRAHRLWEQFLIDQADIAPDHVDRDADQIEHILSREVIERLEARLREQNRLPRAVPDSPHALAPAGVKRVQANPEFQANPERRP